MKSPLYAIAVGSALLHLTSSAHAFDPYTLPLVEVTPRLVVGIQPPAANGQVLTSDELTELAGRHEKPYRTVFHLPRIIMRADRGSGLSFGHEHPESSARAIAVPPGLSEEDARARFEAFPDFERDGYRFAGIMVRIKPVIRDTKLEMEASAGLGYTKLLSFSQLCGMERIPPTKETEVSEVDKIPWDRVTKHVAKSKGLVGTRESLCLHLGELDRGRSATLVLTVVATSRSGWHGPKDFSYRQAPSLASKAIPLVASGAMVEFEDELPERFNHWSMDFNDLDTGSTRRLSEATYQDLKESLAGRWTDLPGTRFETRRGTVSLWPQSPEIHLSVKEFSPPNHHVRLNIRFVGDPQFICQETVCLNRVTAVVIPAVGGHGNRLLLLSLTLPPGPLPPNLNLAGELPEGLVGFRFLAPPTGPIVINVIPGSPAQDAGIEPGDAILKIDGQVALELTPAELTGILNGPPGEVLNLTVRKKRDGGVQQLNMKRVPRSTLSKAILSPQSEAASQSPTSDGR